MSVSKYEKIRRKLERESEKSDINFITFNKSTFNKGNVDILTSIKSYTGNEEDFKRENFINYDNSVDSKSHTILLFDRERYDQRLKDKEFIKRQIDNISIDTTQKVKNGIKSVINKYRGNQDFNFLDNEKKIIKSISDNLDFEKKIKSDLSHILYIFIKEYKKIDLTDFSYFKFVIDNNSTFDKQNTNITIQLCSFIYNEYQKDKIKKKLQTYIRRYIKHLNTKNTKELIIDTELKDILLQLENEIYLYRYDYVKKNDIESVLFDFIQRYKKTIKEIIGEKYFTTKIDTLLSSKDNFNFESLKNFLIKERKSQSKQPNIIFDNLHKHIKYINLEYIIQDKNEINNLKSEKMKEIHKKRNKNKQREKSLNHDIEDNTLDIFL